MKCRAKEIAFLNSIELYFYERYYSFRLTAHQRKSQWNLNATLLMHYNFISRPNPYFEKMSITKKTMSHLISISLNVVNIAFVFWASFKRDAIFNRMRFIFTRCSVRVPVISRE